ncbi:MAG TPA: metallophosphoesterase, partial [Humisphaera sp.]
MYGFLLILGTIVLGNGFWWWWADRRLRPLPLAPLWRAALAAFVCGQLAYLAAFFFAPGWARQSHHVLPADLLGTFYLWSILVLPATVLVTLLLAGGGAVARRANRGRTTDDPLARAGPPAATAPDHASPGGEPRPPLSRRQVLAAAAVAVPPLLTGAGVAYGRGTLHDLEVRRLDVPIPGLPPDLAGLTIAHITDVHVGKFVGRSYLKQVSDATNAAGADLHLLTGDLIDLSVRDLPDAIEFVRNLQPRLAPPVMCEGNHDLLDDPAEFYRQVTAAGIDLVRTPAAVPNEENDARQAAAVAAFARESGRTLVLPGRRPLRLIGERWSQAGLPAPGALGYDV